jgi:NADH:ubiquinone oxidoreductase subunit H
MECFYSLTILNCVSRILKLRMLTLMLIMMLLSYKRYRLYQLLELGFAHVELWKLNQVFLIPKMKKKAAF